MERKRLRGPSLTHSLSLFSDIRAEEVEDEEEKGEEGL